MPGRMQEEFIQDTRTVPLRSAVVLVKAPIARPQWGDIRLLPHSSLSDRTQLADLRSGKSMQNLSNVRRDGAL